MTDPQPARYQPPAEDASAGGPPRPSAPPTSAPPAGGTPWASSTGTAQVPYPATGTAPAPYPGGPPPGYGPGAPQAPGGPGSPPDGGRPGAYPVGGYPAGPGGPGGPGGPAGPPGGQGPGYGPGPGPGYGQGTPPGQGQGQGAGQGQGGPAAAGPGNPFRPAATSEPTPEARRAREALTRLRAEVGKIVIGQDSVVTSLVIALLCRGHVLLEGVPGTAKTLLVRTLSAALSLESKRVQFTPDLMPGDVTGSLVYDARTAEFEFREGPVFTNLLLADEINRTPPKTQASLLEAMEERQVSVEGTPRKLPDPFVVCATQNPLEFEGTYPLPEAQLDRFLMKVAVALPARDEELRVLAAHHAGFDPRDLSAVQAVADADDLAAGRLAVRGVQVAPQVMGYVVDICRATRTSPSLANGASPRGSTALLNTAKAWAWLSGRDYVTPDDVKALARPTLRHRVLLRPEAELEGVTADGVLDSVLAGVPTPR